MFSIGDNVVYPMHGAGKVVGVEERMFANQPTKYLVLTMLLGGMKVHVPFLSVEKVGLRPVSDKKNSDEDCQGPERQDRQQFAQYHLEPPFCYLSG
jgi:CarD family transcriptional regulator